MARAQNHRQDSASDPRGEGGGGGATHGDGGQSGEHWLKGRSTGWCDAQPTSTQRCSRARRAFSSESHEAICAGEARLDPACVSQGACGTRGARESPEGLGVAMAWRPEEDAQA